MTFADKARAKRLCWGIVKWIIIAPALITLAAALFLIALLWYAGNIRAQEAPQVVIICQLSVSPIVGTDRIRLFRARSHAHCYKSADKDTRAYPTTLLLPGDSGRLLALCGKELADCPELP